MPKNALCAEIGTWRGDFSESVLRSTQPRELHLIDPWLFQPNYPRRWYGGWAAKSQADMDRIYEGVCARFGGNADIVTIHRQTSLEAVRAFPDGFFDWVYIDGDHSYEAVRLDLNSWSRKVKHGGFVTGDDYGWRDEERDQSVRRAVDEFVRAQRISDVTIRNGQFILRV